ncbi:MAG: polysaccharide deacetylase family protein [Methylotenera sp.]|nr:polysaccharide deacetylase family protein [Flavobacterium sp.]
MLTVSNYHYIRNNFDTKFPSIFGITPEIFRNQLLLLKNQGDFIEPNFLVDNLKEVLASKANYLLITFDDGLKEQFDCALPILDELNIPALFFINSINHIEKKVSLTHQIHLVRSVVSSDELFESLVTTANRKLSQHEIRQAHQFYRFDNPKSAELKYFLNVLLDFATQEKFINSIFTTNFNEKEVLEKFYMNTNEIQQLIKRGFIGSHTHTHLPLGIYDEKTILYELEITKKYLENLSGDVIGCVAYPYGTKETATEEVGNLAKRAGYKIGFTTEPGINDFSSNPLLLNRFDCNDLIGGKNYK